MKNKILGAIFGLPGVSIAIGVLGFMSSIVSMFIDINAQLSIKWLILALVILGSLVFVLLKVIYDYDVSQAATHPPLFEVPIRYVPEERVFVIRRNEHFVNSIIVGCYTQHDEIDRLAYVGVVHHVQDKVVQIKIYHDLQVLEAIPQTPRALKNLVVKPMVPISALQQINTLEENPNE